MKKTIKKIMSLLMITAITTGILGACSKNDSSVTKSSVEKTSDGKTAATSEKPYEIVMSYLTLGSDPQDLDLVADAISQITKKKINCTVKFKTVPVSNITSQYNLWVSSGEKVDLLMMFQQDLSSYVNEGKILELTDYMDKLPAATAVDKERELYLGGMYNNKLYAVPIVNPSIGEGKAFYTRKDIMDSIDYEQKDIYTYEDLDNIFAQVKAAYPDLITIGAAGLKNNTSADQFISYDTLGVAGGLAGVLMDPMSGDTTVENLFKSDEYYEYLKWMRKWQKSRYLSADAATTSDQASDWIKSGKCAGFYLGDDTPGNKDNAEASLGYEMVQLNIKPTFITTGTYDQLRWSVSSISENPEKVVEFLNMMYDGPEIVNLLMNGIEGKHYVKNGDSMIVSYPKGIDGTNTPYNNVLGIYGDKRNMYMFEPNKDSFYSDSEAYTENALKYKSPALGYTFDSSNYQSEIAAISSVVSKYITTLEYGMATKLDTTYQEFIKALDAAGMDKLIEANQTQLNAWLAEQK
jgi:putative aldouronate transport system substrate-binding protein